jgi:hypothetical protein
MKWEITYYLGPILNVIEVASYELLGLFDNFSNDSHVIPYMFITSLGCSFYNRHVIFFEQIIFVRFCCLVCFHPSKHYTSKI